MRIVRIIILLFLSAACNRSHEDTSSSVSQSGLREKVNMQRIVTKGLSRGFKQRDYTVSKNGNRAFSTIQQENGRRTFIIEMKEGSMAPALAVFSGKYNDLEPMYSPDESMLMFSSDRPLYEGDTTRDFNLWFCTFSGTKLSDPKPFDTIINSAEDEHYPCMNAQGDIYFSARYNVQRNYDIYKSAKTDSGYAEPQVLSFCEDPGIFELNAWIAPSDDLVIFTSYGRKNEVGGGDLFYSQKNSENEWQEPLLLGNINTAGLDYCPFVSGDSLFFTSQRVHDSWAKLHFKYLSDIQRHADTTATGEQAVYVISLSAAMTAKPAAE